MICPICGDKPVQCDRCKEVWERYRAAIRGPDLTGTKLQGAKPAPQLLEKMRRAQEGSR